MKSNILTLHVASAITALNCADVDVGVPIDLMADG